MTSDSAKPSEGAQKLARQIILDVQWAPGDFKVAPRPLFYLATSIDHVAVAPAVKPLVEALKSLVENQPWYRADGTTRPCIEQAHAALEPWRHLLDETGE